MSATLTPERKSARDRPGVGHKMGGLGERKWGRHRRLDRGARGQQARAHSIPDSHPRGQCRSLLPRVLRPVASSCVLPLTMTHRALRPSSLHARVQTLSMRVCSCGMDTEMARTQGCHGHRDGMNTEMTWTQRWHGHSDDMRHSDTQIHDQMHVGWPSRPGCAPSACSPLQLA